MNAQPTLFDYPPPMPRTATRMEREREVARSILERLASERREWLERMRQALALVYLGRELERGEAAFITADDARRLMLDPVFSLPAGASMNTAGALFRSREWEPLDVDAQGRPLKTYPSQTEGSHGNPLVRWRFVGDRAA